MKTWIRKKIYTIMLIMIYLFSVLPMYERLVLSMDKRDNILNSVELCWIYMLLSLFAMGNIASYITKCYDKKILLKFKNMIYIFFNIIILFHNVFFALCIPIYLWGDQMNKIVKLLLGFLVCVCSASMITYAKEPDKETLDNIYESVYYKALEEQREVWYFDSRWSGYDRFIYE